MGEHGQERLMPPTPPDLSLAPDPDASPGQAAQPGFDVSRAHPARIYDYWLGGKDHFPADREAAEQAIRDFPEIVSSVRAQRVFLGRVVRYLAGQAGVRQFLDIGTGLPAANNTHEVAQSVAPESRIVYVDNDPMVLAHARALLASSPEGATDYLDADLRDTGAILERAAATLDFSRPVAVILIGILHLISNEDGPHAIVRQLMATVPPGSWLAILHPASDISAELDTMTKGYNKKSATPATLRSRAEVSAFFDGLNLLPPGLVHLGCWVAESPEPAPEPGMPAWTGLASKP
jgi:S-adenosyl methyltransferase